MNETTIGYLCDVIYLGHEKDENFTFCDNMEGPGGHYAK